MAKFSIDSISTYSINIKYLNWTFISWGNWEGTEERVSVDKKYDYDKHQEWRKKYSKDYKRNK